MFGNEIQRQEIKNNNFIPLIIENTKINFFILGEWKFNNPDYNRNKNHYKLDDFETEHIYLEKTLLIRSKSTNLELIGKHINRSLSTSKYYKRSLSSNRILYNFLQRIATNKETLREEQSNTINHINFDLLSIDSNRSIAYEFCWVGAYYSRKRHEPELEKLFKIYGKNIIKSLREQNIAELEINLAPILSFCDLLNYEKKKKVDMLKINFFIIFGYLIIGMIVLLTRNF